MEKILLLQLPQIDNLHLMRRLLFKNICRLVLSKHVSKHIFFDLKWLVINLGLVKSVSSITHSQQENKGADKLG